MRASSVIRHDSGVDALVVLADLSNGVDARDVERWAAYKRWLMTTEVGPRMDLTDAASLDAFADALIKREQEKASS